MSQHTHISRGRGADRPVTASSGVHPRGHALPRHPAPLAPPATTESGPGRKTGPTFPSQTVTVQTGENSWLHPELISYAERHARQMLGHLEAVRAVSLVVRAEDGEPASCRLHIEFADGPPVVVGHSGGPALTAIDTALETATHIAASRTTRRRIA